MSLDQLLKQHDEILEEVDASRGAVLAFKEQYVVGNPHPWPRSGLARRPHGQPAMLRGTSAHGP